MFVCATATAAKREWIVRLLIIKPDSLDLIIRNSKHGNKVDERLYLRRVKKALQEVYESCEAKGDVEKETRKLFQVKTLAKWFTKPRNGKFWPEQRYLEQWLSEIRNVIVPPMKSMSDLELSDSDA